MFTKFSAYNFTLEGSLPEASALNLNSIKCLQTLTNKGNPEQTNKDEKIKDVSIKKQKITGNYEIIQKKCNFRSISEMGASYVNIYKKIFRTFSVRYIIHCTFSVV